MKKFLAVAVSVLMMMFLLVGCGGKSSGGSSSILGTWKLTGGEAAGQKVDLAGLGMDYTFEFKEGGKCTATIMGQSADTTYTEDGNSISFGDGAAKDLKLTVDKDKMTMDVNGVKLILEKQK